MADPCYSPRVFTPATGQLLSLAQWQGLQTFLISATNLDPEGFRNQNPDSSVSSRGFSFIPVGTRASGTSGSEIDPGFQHSVDPALVLQKEVQLLETLKADAIDFNTNVLPLAHSMGVSLSNYGQSVSQKFAEIAKLLDATNPDGSVILQRLDDLQSRAATYIADAKNLFDAVAAYIDKISASAAAMAPLLNLEGLLSPESEKAQLLSLGTQYDVLAGLKQQAEATILKDRKEIDNAKYYNFLDGIGAILVFQIDRDQREIAALTAKVDDYVRQMSALQAQMNSIRRTFSTLTYVRSFNGQLLTLLGETKPFLELLANAWRTIQAELQNVVQNAKRAGASQLKNQTCLASVQLATAANEWQEVASDAQTFANNFYLKPASQLRLSTAS